MPARVYMMCHIFGRVFACSVGFAPIPPVVESPLKRPNARHDDLADSPFFLPMVQKLQAAGLCTVSMVKLHPHVFSISFFGAPRIGAVMKFCFMTSKDYETRTSYSF